MEWITFGNPGVRYEVRVLVERLCLLSYWKRCNLSQAYQVQTAGRDEGRYLDEKRQENGDESYAKINS